MPVVCLGLFVTVQAVKRACAACGVALRTVNIVGSLKCEGVLEKHRRPGGRGVALFAVSGKAQGGVVRCPLVVGFVASVTVGWDWSESSAGVAVCAVQAGVTAGEREEIMLKIGPDPTGGCMAAFAVGCPAISDVVGRCGAGETGLMTEFALPWRSAELTYSSLEMAALTGSYGVSGDKMKSCACVVGNVPRWPPACLFVAFLAIQSERGSVRVGVATAATPGQIRADRSAVVVTSKTGRIGVRAGQNVACSGLVVERKILPQNLPAFRCVTDSAISGERLVRYERTPLPVPSLPWHLRATVDNEHDADRNKQA
jgi:hypothetical protein